jgi:hypothetical protein
LALRPPRRQLAIELIMVIESGYSLLFESDTADDGARPRLAA